jgi:predicted type IV restriction endonuclease
MDEEAVTEYVDKAQAAFEAAPQMDEANTKAAVLREFLEVLGWRIPENTQLEYSVRAFGKTYKVDYALIVDGAPVAFLEAKGVDTALSETHREQLAAYLKNEDVNLGILTNGEEYEFYRRELDGSTVTVRLLGDARLADLPDRVATLRAFSKDAIQTDEWARILDRIQELRDARETLATEKESLAETVTDVLAEQVSDAIASPAESQAKAMIDRLVAEIDEEIDVENGRTREPGEDPPTPVSHDTGTERDGRYRIVVVAGDGAETVFAASQQADVFVEVVDHLIGDHDVITKIKPLPYIPGRTRPIIHTQTTAAGKEMKQPREVSSGYYVEVNLSSDQKQRELKRLVDECDVDLTFAGEW